MLNYSILDVLPKELKYVETPDGTFKGPCPYCSTSEDELMKNSFVIFPNENRAFCHNTKKNFNFIETIALIHHIIDCEDGRANRNSEPLDIDRVNKVYAVADDIYGKEFYEQLKNQNIIQKIKRSTENVNWSRRKQIENFWEEQPFFYDKNKIFWMWDREEYRWIMCDEIDFCNSISDTLGIDTIESKERTEIVEGVKQVGRQRIPEPAEKSWVQFKDKIYDVKSLRHNLATPEYFITNPIPHKVGISEDTPTIDRLFGEWMAGQDESWKQTLYEIMAYNICPDKFMQRMIYLHGAGSNGKGTFLKLNYKFLGDENCVCSEIKSLSEDRFEAAVLYRKLLCVMGEVSAEDLKNTNMLKKLAGEDKISFQFKGKTPFTDYNTASCIAATNSLPSTPDKSQGFYRKNLIVDFLNQFKAIDAKVTDAVPDIEYSNLALKCINILHRLYNNPHFTNEGSFEERETRYEERSNPVIRFVNEYCIEDANHNTSLRDFTSTINKYLKSTKQRILTSHFIGKKLREEGFIIGNRKIKVQNDDGDIVDVSAVLIMNIGINIDKLNGVQQHI